MRRNAFLAAVVFGAFAAAAAAQNTTDNEFVRKAALSGMKEVQVSQHAASSAANPEVKQFASQLVRDHTSANEKLKAAAGTMNVTLPAEMDAEHRAQAQRLTGMTGAGLDRGFVDHMVESHGKSITLFESESQNGSGALREFAAATLPTLREHLRMAQDLQGRLTTGAATSPATTTGTMGTMGTERTTETTGTTGTTERMDEPATTTGQTESAMPATASRYPMAAAMGAALLMLGLALKLRK
jgi:putative membrane protein